MPTAIRYHAAAEAVILPVSAVDPPTVIVGLEPVIRFADHELTVEVDNTLARFGLIARNSIACPVTLPPFGNVLTILEASATMKMFAAAHVCTMTVTVRRHTDATEKVTFTVIMLSSKVVDAMVPDCSRLFASVHFTDADTRAGGAVGRLLASNNWTATMKLFPATTVRKGATMLVTDVALEGFDEFKYTISMWVETGSEFASTLTYIGLVIPAYTSEATATALTVVTGNCANSAPVLA
jgi:hypothetical protein